jgi:hypothetical protein
MWSARAAFQGRVELSDFGSSFDRRLLVAVDAMGYGSGTDRDHFAVQTGLTSVLDTAAAQAGLRRDLWLTQKAGDGELAILPRDEPEPVVVDQYVRYLDEALKAHNADPVSGPRIRLRMAIHFGAAMQADNGYAGQGIVAVSRLVDSALVKQALAGVPEASLVVVLSRQIYDDVVRQGHVSIPEAELTKVGVQVKEYRDEAWVRVVGGPHRSAAGSRPAGDQPAEHGTPREAPGVSQSFYGDFHNQGTTTFGNSFGARNNG